MIKGFDNKAFEKEKASNNQAITKVLSGIGSKMKVDASGSPEVKAEKVKVEKAEKPVKTKVEKPAKAEKPAKVEKPAKAEKVKAEKPTKAEGSGNERPTLKDYLKEIGAEKMTREEVNAKIKKVCEEKGWQVWSRVLVKSVFDSLKAEK